MLLTVAWFSTALFTPSCIARRNLRLGREALARYEFSTARRFLQRAARHEPLREEAICLLAEADLVDRRPSDALFALNQLLLECEEAHKPRSARVRLLRGIAGCMLGRAAAARRELAGILRSEATIDDLLAAAQACIMANDHAGAQQLLEDLEDSPEPIGGRLAARIRICRAALYYRLNALEKALAALPPDDMCTPADAVACRRARAVILHHLRSDRIAV